MKSARDGGEEEEEAKGGENGLIALSLFLFFFLKKKNKGNRYTTDTRLFDLNVSKNREKEPWAQKAK